MSNATHVIQNHLAPGFMRLPDVMALLRVSKATVYRWMAEGEFPRQRPMTRTGSAVAWSAAQVYEWIASKHPENDGTYDGISINDGSEAA